MTHSQIIQPQFFLFIYLFMIPVPLPAKFCSR